MKVLNQAGAFERGIGKDPKRWFGRFQRLLDWILTTGTSGFDPGPLPSKEVFEFPS